MFLFSSYSNMFTGEYQQNLCAPGAQGCTPCSQRLPSCQYLNDGNHAFPGREGTSSYITCLKGRTVAVSQCAGGVVFDQYRGQCLAQTTSTTTIKPTVNSGNLPAVLPKLMSIN
jgi:hypothetical protein